MMREGWRDQQTRAVGGGGGMRQYEDESAKCQQKRARCYWSPACPWLSSMSAAQLPHERLSQQHVTPLPAFATAGCHQRLL